MNQIKKGIASAGFKQLVKSNFSRAEEIQDEFQATKVKRMVRGERRRKKIPLYVFPPEAKQYRNNGVVAMTVNNLTQIVELTQFIVRGTDNNTRIGDKINIKSILSRISVESPAANNIGDNCSVRVMLIYDRQSNGAVAEIAKLLQDPTQVYSPLNSDNSGRYRVIWDKIFMCMTDTSKNNVLITENNIFKTGLPVRYDANAGAITDVEHGSLTLLATYNPRNVMTTAPNIVWDMKVTYYDN